MEVKFLVKKIRKKSLLRSFFGLILSGKILNSWLCLYCTIHAGKIRQTSHRRFLNTVATLITNMVAHQTSIGKWVPGSILHLPQWSCGAAGSLCIYGMCIYGMCNNVKYQGRRGETSTWDKQKISNTTIQGSPLSWGVWPTAGTWWACLRCWTCRASSPGSPSHLKEQSH